MGTLQFVDQNALFCTVCGPKQKFLKKLSKISELSQLFHLSKPFHPVQNPHDIDFACKSAKTLEDLQNFPYFSHLQQSNSQLKEKKVLKNAILTTFQTL